MAEADDGTRAQWPKQQKQRGPQQCGGDLIFITAQKMIPGRSGQNNKNKETQARAPFGLTKTCCLLG
jgi:hypothetical protein